MKILIHDYSGHPFQVQLSRSLASRGYDVLHLYYGYNNTPKGDLSERKSDPKNLRIRPIYTKRPINKYSFIKRWFEENQYGQKLAEETIAFQPDIVFSSNTALNSLRYYQESAKQTGSFFIFWLQDITSLAVKRILSQKYPIIGSIIGNYYINLEKKLLENSHAVVGISEDFGTILDEWKITKKKIHFIPNWAPLESFPMVSKNNEWALANNLIGTFSAIYSGSLGLKHNPEILVHTAKYMAKYSDFRLVVVSEGLGANYIRKKIETESLKNLILLNFQPFEAMPNVLGSANVLLAILEPEAGIFSVPSKVLSALCAGRPMLLSCPLENLASRIISQNQAGLVIEPGNMQIFSEELEKMYLSRNLLGIYGKNARSYAEQNYDIETITDKFERIWLSAN
jgi:colanic acid biosynthesis glycosyl transferase WcaI